MAAVFPCTFLTFLTATLQVVLTVSNTSETSRGILEVSKGCGKRMVLEAQYQGSSKYDSSRQCYVTNVIKNNKVINNKFAEGNSSEFPVLTDATSATTSTSSQEELCYCQGSECNQGAVHGTNMGLVLLLGLLNLNQFR